MRLEMVVLEKNSFTRTVRMKWFDSEAAQTSISEESGGLVAEKTDVSFGFVT